MEIISIQGASGVGKTSLLHRLHAEYPALRMLQEINDTAIIARTKRKLSVNEELDFIGNQKIFIHHTTERLKNQQDAIILLDRGPEDIEFFSLYYPKINHWQLNVERELATEFKALRSYSSKWIIYLVASETELRKRVILDQTRKRKSFEQNLRLLPDEIEWYSKFPTTFIQTDRKSIEEVYQEVILLLKGRGFIK